MKAILIDPVHQSLSFISVSGLDDIIKVIGYDTIEQDPVGDDGDLVCFDENCFVRGTEGRFKIDSLVPLAGKGVVVGSTNEGAALKDVTTDLKDLRSRIKYL